MTNLSVPEMQLFLCKISNSRHHFFFFRWKNRNLKDFHCLLSNPRGWLALISGTDSSSEMMEVAERMWIYILLNILISGLSRYNLLWSAVFRLLSRSKLVEVTRRVWICFLFNIWISNLHSAMVNNIQISAARSLHSYFSHSQVLSGHFSVLLHYWRIICQR